MNFYDHVVVDEQPRITSDGYLVASVKAGRTGIQLYRGDECGKPDMDVVRVYRPPEEVFSDIAVHSYAHRPVTNGHPSQWVTADTWKRHAVGQTGDEVLREGDFVRVPLALMDAEMIGEVQAGKRQLSWGYACDLVFEDGETPDGARYDAVQRNIRANHLAVVVAARGGPELKIGDDKQKDEVMNDKVLKTITVDGLSVEMTDIAAQAVQKTIGGLEKTVADQKTELATRDAKIKDLEAQIAKVTSDAKTDGEAKDAKIATLNKQIEDAQVGPAELDQLVKDRAAIIDQAKAVIGEKLVTDGKSNAEIQRQVVDAKLGDVAKNWTDEQVAASFGTLTAKVSGTDRLGSALSHTPPTNAADARAKAFHDEGERLRLAWQNPGAA